jgi:WD40 repeat protein
LTDRPGAVSLAVSSDGGLAAVGRSDGGIGLWDLTTGTAVAPLTGHEGPVSALAFSPDGAVLASGGFDQTVTLWRVPGRDRWATLVGHRGNVLSVAWSPDGQVLYTGSTDHSISAWQADPVRASAIICAELPRDFPDTAPPDCG